MKEIIVSKKYDEKKLNSFLLDSFDGLKLNTLYKALRKKDVRVNDIKVSDNVIIHAGDIIKVFIPDDQLFNKNNFKVSIVYEDDNIVVVNKPAGLLCVGTDKEKIRTLYHEAYEYVHKKNKNNRIFIVHRLDRETRGLVIFAKSEKVKYALQSNWDKVIRKYYAIVVGNVKNKKARLEHYLKEDKPYLISWDKSKIDMPIFDLISPSIVTDACCTRCITVLMFVCF